MSLVNLLVSEQVCFDMTATNKEEAIAELVDKAIESGIDMTRDEIIETFLEREALGSTGIGLSVAVPHIRLDSIEHCIVILGKSKQGFEFASIDGKPVHLAFMIFGPTHEDHQENYLSLMASISKMLQKDTLRRELIATQDQESFLKLVSDNA